MKLAITRCIISCLIAGALAGLLTHQSGADVRTSIVAGLIMALKDLQAYITPTPQEHLPLRESGLSAYVEADGKPAIPINAPKEQP